MSEVFLLIDLTKKPPSSGMTSLKSKLLQSLGKPEKTNVNQKSRIKGTGVQLG
ncbi:hypothetical protein [Chryseobacterium taihuense]|uniref:Uncharacterized protein n=1 Tax=Chryseobacterium taihuense TaxID=1141221 RepID=A0ABY0R2B3_9FLAO|nr:hypothetical protein [Chryseobacterium taihuense]SDM30853.1 hypothetical protein SAMN05216273_12141 [Chryseobacterium taihuense]